MNLLVRNGTIVTAEGQQKADILCENGLITRIENQLEAAPGTKEIDAKGKYIFPGFIDPHVHVHLPSTGTHAKDTYETASKAALLGGTTCFIDFVIPGRDEGSLSALETWNSKATGNSSCDYSFHMVAARFNDQIESELQEVVKKGIPSFKIHLAYADVLGLTDEELYKTIELAKKLGVITLGHCENAYAIEALREKHVTEGKLGPEWHYHTRPPIIEADGTHHFLTFAEILEAHAYVVHVSCHESLSIAKKFADRGNNVWVESLIQFLLLDKSLAETNGFEGAKYIMSPPLREKGNQDTLWQALRDGGISTIATDHAPFDFAEQKEQGKENFTRIPSGLPGIQDRGNLLFTYGVQENRITPEQFVDAISTQAAKIFGMYPRKGTIQVGSDADLVIYNPDAESTISAQQHAMNVDYNAFENWTLKGAAEHVTVRGKVVVEDGQFIGSTEHGQFIPREPTHF